MNNYPLDILSIPDGEINSWLDQFYMHDSPVQLWDMNDAIKDAYYDVIRRNLDSNPEIGELMLIQLKLYLDFSISILSKRLIDQIRKEGKTASFAPASTTYRGLWENGVPLKAYWSPHILPRYTAKEKYHLKARFLRLNIRNNGLAFPKYLYPSKNAWTSINCGELDVPYAKSMGKKFAIVAEVDYAAGYCEKEEFSPLQDQIAVGAEEILEALKQVANTYSIELGSPLEKYLFNLIKLFLHCTAAEFDYLKRKFSRYCPCFLLGYSQNSGFTRSLAAINRREGGEVTGALHGNEVTRVRDFRKEMSFATHFLTYNQQSVPFIDESIKRWPLFDKRPEIISIKSDYFKDITQNLRAREKLPEKIKNVMIISSYYSLDCRTSCVYNDLFYLDIEIRLVNFLSAAGYEVLYKAHPDGLYNKLDFDKYFAGKAKIIKEPFEQVYNQADAMLFFYSETSTFFWTFCTLKPIINIDRDFHYGGDYLDETKALIAKRCRVVKGYHDERNRFMFDENQLKESLAAKPEMPNDEYLNKYMICQ